MVASPENSHASSPVEPKEKLVPTPGVGLKSASVNTRYPPAGMVVSGRMRNFVGAWRSSVMNQPPILTVVAVGLNNSMASNSGRSVCVSSSLTRIGAITGGAGSSAPGEPPGTVLGRQLAFSPQVSHGAFSLTMTREKPSPSVTGYHLLS